VYSKKPEKLDYKHNTHCIIIFVALDEDGKPNPVPAFVPENEEDKKMENYARRLMELRKGIEDEMSGFAKSP
jgi:acyl-CoA hydrolase